MNPYTRLWRKWIVVEMEHSSIPFNLADELQFMGDRIDDVTYMIAEALQPAVKKATAAMQEFARQIEAAFAE